jgi:hypothetical protein
MLCRDYLVLNVLLKSRRERPLIVLPWVNESFVHKLFELTL